MITNRRPKKTRSSEEDMLVLSMDKTAMMGMMPKTFWEKRWALGNVSREEFALATVRSTYQFYFAHHNSKILGYNYCNYPKKKVCAWKEKLIWYPYDAVEMEEFLYPNQNVTRLFDHFKLSNTRLLPPSLYKKIEVFKQQYEKIKVVEDDDVLWFDALKEYGDYQFIIDNVEYRLGGNLENRNLWKMYIEYLKGCEAKKLLQTYSKYCRVFPSDEKMLKDYEEAAIKLKLSPVNVPWLKLLPFEKHDSHFFNDEIASLFAERTVAFSTPMTAGFNSSTAFSQQFSLPLVQLQCIRENSSAELLFKLYQCCKWFPLRFRKTLCQKFLLGSYSSPYHIVDSSLRADGSQLQNLSDLYISKVFGMDRANVAPAELIKRIYRCDADIVSICAPMTWNQIQFFLHHGKVEYLILDLQRNKPDFVLEQVMFQLPNVKRITTFNIQCTSDTSKKLCEMKFNNLISCVDIERINSTALEPSNFANFVIKNCNIESKIFLNFEEDVDPEFVKNFDTVLRAALAEAWGSLEEMDIEIE